ncbi:MAG TPA: oxygenase MpaB family protein [Thermoanaerobaculia bacterium]|nr:oxygenase MpaB family protein [Thermoanaerobaculia bacterium]
MAYRPAAEHAPEAPGERPGSRVDAVDLERELSAIRTRVADPTAGLYGPGSQLWEVNREAVIFLGGARAALLQLAHPYVAEAIDQHSSTRRDPLGRFQRTFRSVFGMVYGDLESAFTAARRVHGVHTRIRGRLSEALGTRSDGTPYLANDPQALLWVHATLWDTSVLLFEKVVRALTVEEKDRYYRETRLFAKLFGIPDSLLPASWADFERYNRDMWRSAELEVGRAAREIGAFLFEPQHPTLTPAMWWLRQMTAALMPQPLGRAFGLPYGRAQGATYALSIRALRWTRPLWPRRLRFVPPYLAALRRIAKTPGRDRTGELMARLWLGPAENRPITAAGGSPDGSAPPRAPAPHAASSPGTAGRDAGAAGLGS